jgi:pyrimidine operon attenuation protein/uracil phosphoribosyltransferase
MIFLLGVPLAGVNVARKLDRDAESLNRNEVDSESVEVGESLSWMFLGTLDT